MEDKIELKSNGRKEDAKMGKTWGEKGLRWMLSGKKNTTKENIRMNLRHKMSNPYAVSQKLLPDKMWKLSPHWWDAGTKTV